MTIVVYTIGHSTRSIEDFVALLQREGIRTLIDVRAFPMSRRHPHFNREVLAPTLAESTTLAYRHARPSRPIAEERPRTRSGAGVSE